MKSFKVRVTSTDYYYFYVDADNVLDAEDQAWELIGENGEELEMLDPNPWKGDIDIRAWEHDEVAS